MSFQTSEMADAITNLSKEVHADNTLKGFYDSESFLLQSASLCDASDIGYRAITDADKIAIRNAFIMQKLALVHTEVSEAVEAMRMPGAPGITTNIKQGVTDNMFDSDASYAVWYKERVKDTFPAELAGTIIRVLDLAGWLGIDIGAHIVAELRYNRTKSYRRNKTC